MERRLPVYFLVDCSESMIGDGIESVQQGLEEFLKTLRRDPRCLESVWISIITFDQSAQQIVPLTELMDVQLPVLEVRPGTCMGAAYKLLAERLSTEVRRGDSNSKGDWRPLVFVITDGQPTDGFSKIREAIDSISNPRIANVYAIGCGEDVDFSQLNEISDIVLKMAELDSEGIKKLFIWLTASVQSASVEISNTSGSGFDIDLSKLPKEITKVEKNEPKRTDDRPRQVFVKSRCSFKGKDYLMRYKLDPRVGYYMPIKSHPLVASAASSGASFKLPPISSDLLAGPGSCPFCGNTSCGVCSCGQVFCIESPPPSQMTCPGCKQNIPLGSGKGGFDIRQSEG